MVCEVRSKLSVVLALTCTLDVEAGLDLLCCLRTSCCCVGRAVEKDGLLGVVEGAVGSSYKSFLPITAEAQVLLGHSLCGT